MFLVGLKKGDTFHTYWELKVHGRAAICIKSICAFRNVCFLVVPIP